MNLLGTTLYLRMGLIVGEAGICESNKTMQLYSKELIKFTIISLIKSVGVIPSIDRSYYIDTDCAVNVSNLYEW